MEHCSEFFLTLHAGEVSTTQTGFSTLEEEYRNVSVQAHCRKAPFISLLLFCFKSPFTSTVGMRPSITLNTFSQHLILGLTSAYVATELYTLRCTQET